MYFNKHIPYNPNLVPNIVFSDWFYFYGKS